MKTYKTVTGMGYIKDGNGDIVCKVAERKLETEYPLKDGYEFVEVTTQGELDAVEIAYTVTDEQLHAVIVQNELIEMAKERAKTEGLLDADGNPVKAKIKEKYNV